MLKRGTKAIDFKFEVRNDLQGHFQGQKAKNPTSWEQPNFGCSHEVPNSVLTKFQNLDVLTKFKNPNSSSLWTFKASLKTKIHVNSSRFKLQLRAFLVTPIAATFHQLLQNMLIYGRCWLFKAQIATEWLLNCTDRCNFAPIAAKYAHLW